MRAPDGSPASGVGCGMLRGESRTGEKKKAVFVVEEAFEFLFNVSSFGNNHACILCYV